jgi:hypothetical protein
MADEETNGHHIDHVVEREQNIESIRESGYNDALWFAETFSDGVAKRADDPSFIDNLAAQHPSLTRDEVRAEYINGVKDGLEQNNGLAESESVEGPATRWTLQQFSTNPVGKPWMALQETDEQGAVLRAFTGTREELNQIIREAHLKPEELAPISEAEYHQQALKRVAEIASELGEYASQQAPLPYIPAEAAIAESFRQQLSSGSKIINLSQRYATDDQTAAQARHEKALENLKPLIDQTAQLAGYKVERGAAIAEGLNQREVPAIVQHQRYSMSV